MTEIVKESLISFFGIIPFIIIIVIIFDFLGSFFFGKK